MTLFFEDEGERALPIDCEAVARRVIAEAVRCVGCPYETETSLLLTTDEAIRELNRRFRGIDRATDVLSFPMIDYPEAGRFDFVSGQIEYFQPETGELMLGDIVISVDRVLAQAEEYGHSVEREYAFLIAHSMLHLFGYDHEQEPERMEMEEKQEDILTRLQILR